MLEIVPAMARNRRKARASKRLNLEIVGIVAMGVAVLFALALFVPGHAGYIGARVARELHVLFGTAAWMLPVVVAFTGGIVFLEINVPRLIAKYGTAAVAYFLLLDAAYDLHGGIVGASIAHAFFGLFGGVGASLVLILLGLLLTIWITDISVKRAIGWCILIGARFHERLRAHDGVQRPRSAEQKPGTLREAFHLPILFGRLPPPAVQVLGPVGASSALATVSAPSPGRAMPADSEIGHVDDEDEEDEDDDDSGVDEGDDVGDDDEDEYDDDDADEDDEDEADEDEDEDDEGAEDEDDDDDDSVGKPGDAVHVGATGAAPVGRAQRMYRLPDLSLFDPPQVQLADDSTRSAVLEDTLASFGVGARVVHIQRGPSITRYELKPERGVKISRISSLADDLALALAATSVRIEAPIPGKSAVGIEIPNTHTSVVAIREIFEALPQRGTIPPLNMALGKDITGRAVFGDLGKMPHLLVAGATGSGKSVCLNCIIASLLVCATPDQVQLLMIDPKRVELTVYNGIPHLVKDVITDARLAAGALFEMTKEMDTRYERFARAGVRKIEEYNQKYPNEKLPYVVIVIDELADLMMIAPAKVETTIMRIAQLARATGIHLIVATQRPSVDVITGLIKANIPSRIAFAVSSQVDSRTILDQVGAERLLGRGDMLYLPIDAPKPVRSQGALITGGEVNRLVEFWASQARPENSLQIDVTPIDDDDRASQRAVDPFCYDAAKSIIVANYASTAQLQSQFSIGHPRAVRIMKQLEEFGVVGPHEGTKARRINIGIGELETIAGRLGKSEQTDLFAQEA